MRKKWKMKVIIALLGIVSLSIWSGFGNFGDVVPPQACGCLPPEYVAHFTDQEAIDIIRVQLEAVGLNFNSAVPLYNVELWGGGRRWGRNVGIDLFDAERNVSITLINMYDDAISSITEDGGGFSYSWESNHIETEFSENFAGIHFGVFYNSTIIRQWRDQNRKRPHTAEEIELLTERLEAQVQEFIHQLQEEGVID